MHDEVAQVAADGDARADDRGVRLARERHHVLMRGRREAPLEGSRGIHDDRLAVEVHDRPPSGGGGGGCLHEQASGGREVDGHGAPDG
ncbi:hypothetical protein MAFF212519_10020 [Clavibacter michiganensis]